MPTGTLCPLPQQYILTTAGVAASGAQVSFYVAGTSTSASVYSDVGLSVPLSQPVKTSAGGRLPAIYLTPGISYKVTVSDAAGATIYTQDNVAAVPTSSNNVDITGTAGEALTAGQVVYQSDGSGSKTAGQWYRSDSTNAYSSTLNAVGIVPSAIASGSTGTIRLSGSITGVSGLTVGTLYYVDSVLGGVTSTPPGNKRLVGQADTTTSLVFVANPPVSFTIDNHVCDGRLTLTTAVPVTTADVTGATTVYFAPYAGKYIALYDGTATWTQLSFAETSLALGTMTNALPYDIFAYNNSGTLALEKLAWTDGTTRATALVLQDGVLVKTGATTRRYLGSFYTTSTTATEDSAAKRLLYNYYNKVMRPMRRLEATASWSYNGGYRQANAATANQLAIMQGWAESALSMRLIATSNSAASNAYITFGEDSTTVASANALVGFYSTAATNWTHSAALDLIPAVGYHYYAWIEKDGGATTFYGTNAVAPDQQSGLTGVWWA